MATIAQEFIQQGIEQGIGQGIEQSIIRVLRQRFGEVPATVHQKLSGLTQPELESLLDEALLVTTLDEFMVR